MLLFFRLLYFKSRCIKALGAFWAITQDNKISASAFIALREFNFWKFEIRNAIRFLAFFAFEMNMTVVVVIVTLVVFTSANAQRVLFQSRIVENSMN